VHLVLRAWSCYTNFMAISFMEGMLCPRKSNPATNPTTNPNPNPNLPLTLY